MQQGKPQREEWWWREGGLRGGGWEKPPEAAGSQRDFKRRHMKIAIKIYSTLTRGFQQRLQAYTTFCFFLACRYLESIKRDSYRICISKVVLLIS